MSDSKIDRANLRRQAQRVEPYTSLVCRQRAILRNSNGNSAEFMKSRSESIVQKCGSFKDSDKENEGKKENESIQANCWSPTTSERSSSSDSSQEYQPDNRFLNLKTPSSSYPSELELTSVMTRSATRKYATVGALHNKVDLEQELSIKKRWPVNVSCPPPLTPKDNNSHLKDLMTRSLNKVMSFCKTVTELTNEELEEVQPSTDVGQDLPDIIDLTPYLTQEPLIVNGTEETQITLHLNDDFISRQLLSIISTGENQSGTLIIQEDNEEYRYNTITLHSGDFTNELTPSTKLTAEFAQSVYPIDTMFAVTNDHTYAQKYAENYSWAARNLGTSCLPEAVNKQPESSFAVNKALNDLLLNTVILKCLICGDTPQEMITFLENAKE